MENFAESRIGSIAAELSGELAAHHGDLNEKPADIVNENQSMNMDLKKGIQEVGERYPKLKEH